MDRRVASTEAQTGKRRRGSPRSSRLGEAVPASETSLRQPLRVLVLEDSARDAELVVRELRDAGYDLQWARVDAEEDYRAQIRLAPDIILADYRLPQFDAVSALQIVHDENLSIPFVVVSGTISADMAVSLLHQGADDFVLKDRLVRPIPAVRNALERQRLRRWRIT